MQIATYFFQLQNQLKLYHWQTPVYARHLASDSLLNGLLPQIDTFMEILQGKKNQRIGMNTNNVSISIQTYDDDHIIDYLRNVVKDLMNIEKTFGGVVTSKDTDLLNIRDDMVGQINKALYLFTFH